MNQLGLDGDIMNPYRYLKKNELINNPLCSLGSSKDTFNLSNGNCTRYVKKIILTGNETYQKYVISTYNGFYISNKLDNDYNCTMGLSTHYPVSDNQQLDNVIWLGLNSRVIYFVGIADVLNIETASEFKIWLQNQYNNGNPFTIWYLSSSPTTSIISIPSGLSGTVEGFLTQSGIPSPTNPIYPIANNAIGWYSCNSYIKDTIWQSKSGYKRSSGEWT